MGKQKSKRPAPSCAKNRKTAASGRSARPATRKATKPKADPRPAVTQQQRQEKPGRASKQGQVIAMLQAPQGATIDAMSDATGWQPHSVRGFLAGVVRKKLGLDLASSAAEGGRIYRIADRQIADRPGANVDAAAVGEPA